MVGLPSSAYAYLGYLMRLIVSDSTGELARQQNHGHHRLEKAMPERTLSIEGVQVPRFLYGTAWKEDETQRLTELALRQGFRGIDTANQRRHYHEAAVGQAIVGAVAS